MAINYHELRDQYKRRENAKQPLFDALLFALIGISGALIMAITIRMAAIIIVRLGGL